jgi:hypothetical protein
MGEASDSAERQVMPEGRQMAGTPSRKTAPTSTPEIEFALVISRMIDTVKADPEHLRAAVYELARHKLKEQFGTAPDIEQLSESLEVAIRGVEAFTINNVQQALPGTGEISRLVGPPAEVRSETIPVRWGRSRWLSAPMRLLAVLAIVLSIGFVAKQKGASIETLRQKASQLAMSLKGQVPQKTTPELPEATTKVNVAPLPPKPPLLPTAFGVYAISEDKLYELEQLPGRVPDTRVAISAAILTPSRTVLPDGHLRFVVFKRDSATNASDRAEVRVVASIANEMTFDQAGKPTAKKAEDSWVIRNISIPYRTAPKQGEPDMYEVQSENPETALSPGRYVLVLKSQAYDFSVAGTITDPKQCLERLAASNGQFYSECPIGKKPAKG